MFTKNALRLAVLIGALACAGVAQAQDKVHNYLNETSLKVKATEDPVQKREILSKNLATMSHAVATAERSPLTSPEDAASLNRLQTTLQEKSDELAGVNGYDRVPDDQLNAFSSYVVQDMEQADQKITIGLVTLLLIIIIVILIA